MAVKKCYVETCNSCSTRKEDFGVTYHKIPKEKELRDIWMTACHIDKCASFVYVCSRHFCKNDFQVYKDSKYMLKSDAVPSIFQWNMTDNKESKMEEEKTDDELKASSEQELLNSSKESDGENLDAIKKFIANQEKEIAAHESATKESIANPDEKLEAPDIKDLENKSENVENNITLPLNSAAVVVLDPVDSVEIKEENKSENEDIIEEKDLDVEVKPELESVSSVLDVIHDAVDKAIKSKRKPVKAGAGAGDKGSSSSMSLSVGSKVEAKDYSEDWYPAQIVEVDYDEMEVLVHYENVSKRHDEWISVSSPRLRPISSDPVPPKIDPNKVEDSHVPMSTGASVSALGVQVKDEPKTEEKQKLLFVVGERCLARWKDNRRFMATVACDLGEGKYEIVFDDGFRWTCHMSRLTKKRNSLSVDTTLSGGVSTPVDGSGPSGKDLPPAPVPAYHTHLFDPTRDYLGSKSERREMKRKLNIKEIFNIGQKKKKTEGPSTPKKKPPKNKVVKETKPKVVVKKPKPEPVAIKSENKPEIPDAVASIIGTVTNEDPVSVPVKLEASDIKTDVPDKKSMENLDDAVVKDEPVENGPHEDEKILEDNLDLANSETLSAPETMKLEDPMVMEEDLKPEKFDQANEEKHELVIHRMKEVINKLEDGLNQTDHKVETVDVTTEIKDEMKEIKDDVPKPVVTEIKSEDKTKKSVSKIKKSKKLRLLQEKRVKKQVEMVKNELEEMKKQVEEMRKQMLQKTEELEKSKGTEMPESFLLPGEWCCKWVNGQPVGTVSEIECEPKGDANNKPGLPRRSVQVEDKRLPPGWTKHMVRRSFGHSAGKWDVVLVSPDNHRFHTKTDMKSFFENCTDDSLKPYEGALMDFGVHLKLSRRMGWYTTTPGGEQDNNWPAPTGIMSTTSPLVKKKGLSSKKKEKRRKLTIKLKVPRHKYRPYVPDAAVTATGVSDNLPLHDQSVPGEDLDHPPLEDGYVYVGSLKVQIIENLLRCPADGCFKNFRNDTLLKMHIKHYHRELRKMLGATPKVLDLAYARTRPSAMEMRQLKLEMQHKTLKVKLPRLPRLYRVPEVKLEPKVESPELKVEVPQIKSEEKIPRSQDSPKLRNALVTKPVKRPKVLLPVRRPEPMEIQDPVLPKNDFEETSIEPKTEIPTIEPLDFETAISTHTVTKPFADRKKAFTDKKRKSFPIAKKNISEDEEYFTMNSDVDTRSSYPRSGTPDSKTMDQKLMSSESNEDQKEVNMYMFSENGERIKIVHMKREEIINCHCGFREEDGLMVQCELCLCWQHALCHNIQKESDVPEKYTCSICLNPRRGRRSQRFLHDQDRLYEGLLPGAKPCEGLRRSHELSGNLLRIEDALHALRVKYYVATKKDHPKLYLWAKDWETGEISMTQEKLNSDYSDLNIMITNIGKENLPVKHEDMKDMQLDLKTPPSEDHDERYTHRENHLGSQALLSGLLSSPGAASLDLPISTSELERLAKTVQEQENSRARVIVPQPEAAIENSACRERLLRHIQRCQTLIDARLDSIEAQVAELESQDPSFEDDETADYFPRTKQTIQMLMRDLDTMEELGIIT